MPRCSQRPRNVRFAEKSNGDRVQHDDDVTVLHLCLAFPLHSRRFRAYNANDHPQQTLDLFQEMRDKAKIKPNNVSYTLYFQACAALNLFDQAKAMHNELKEKVSSYMKNKVKTTKTDVSSTFSFSPSFRNCPINSCRCISPRKISPLPKNCSGR